MFNYGELNIGANWGYFKGVCSFLLHRKRERRKCLYEVHETLSFQSKNKQTSR